ncbi:MAG: isochorismatase family protein [Pirellulaceae bacterium]|jgi:nicotinamidase-related amidase|nr:isochorismatase family protein [Pirellulaceae bacterium]MDP7014343.1 isochorismatase family protein [Pirellulaceae bacterium]
MTSPTASPVELAIVLVDVQSHFLKAVNDPEPLLARLEQLLIVADWFDIPVISTTEGPVDCKGTLAERLARRLPENSLEFTKQTYDLCSETEIRDALSATGRSQFAVAGGETDVCVLQSALGLLNMGFAVFVLEDCVFSSECKADAAWRRLAQAGAVPTTFKSLFYELVHSEQNEFWTQIEQLKKLGWTPPESLPPRE